MDIQRSNHKLEDAWHIEVRRPACCALNSIIHRGVNVWSKVMSTLFQPTALVGAIALAMGFSTSVSAQDSSNVVNASLDTLVITATTF